MDKKEINMVIKGKAMWAKVFEPDTNFDIDGVYSIEVVMPEDEAASVCEQLDEFLDEEFASKVKANPKLKNSLSMRKPYFPEVDKNGDETGNIVFRTKKKAKGKKRDGTPYEAAPPVVQDAKRNPIKGVLIGNDSIVKVALTARPYLMQSTKQVGLTLRLNAVQVIKLEEYRGGGNFFEEEEGYVAEAVSKDDANDYFNDASTESTSDDEGDF